MAATLAFDDQQPTVGYNFVVGGQKDGHEDRKDVERENIPRTERCHGFEGNSGREMEFGAH